MSKAKRLLDDVKEKIGGLFTEESPVDAFERGAVAPTVQSQKKLLEQFELKQLLPYESYDENTGLYYNEDSVGWVLLAQPSLGLPEQTLKIIDGLMASEHKKNTAVSISLYSNPNVEMLYDNWLDARSKNKGRNEAFYQAWAQRRIQYMKKAKWSSLFPDENFLVKDFVLVISYTVPMEEGRYPHEASQGLVEMLQRKQKEFIGTLKSASIPASPMYPRALINLIASYLEPTDSARIRLEYDDQKLIKEQVTGRETNIKVNDEEIGIKHGRKTVAALPFTVRQYPEAWGGWNNHEWLGKNYEAVLRLPCPFVYTTTVIIPDQVALKAKLMQRQARATQMSENIGKWVPVWGQRKRDADHMVQQNNDGSKAVIVNNGFLLFPEPDQRQPSEQSFKAIMGSLGFTVERDMFAPLYSFCSHFPMMFGRQWQEDTDKLSFFTSMSSFNAVNLCPWLGEWSGNSVAGTMLVGRRGQLGFFDPFSNTKGNFNMAVAAASGAGKSFLTHEILMTALSGAGRAFVIDSGRSYEQTCELLGGAYLDFGDESDICLNPFTWLKDLDEIPMIKELVCAMCSTDHALSQNEKSFVEQAIVSAWNAKGNEADITLIQGILRERDEPETRVLANALHPFTRDGMHGKYFDGEANISFDNELVVLELDDLNERADLQQIVLMLLIIQINQTIYLSDRSQRKYVIIDEAWRLLGSGSGDFIESGYRTARKYGGSFMTVTQGMTDFMKSDASKAALENSDWVIYLRQKPDSLDRAIKEGLISGGESVQTLLRNLTTEKGKYSQLAISGPEGIAGFHLVVDEFSGATYSTDAQQVQFIKDLQRKGVPLPEAIERSINIGQ